MTSKAIDGKIKVFTSNKARYTIVSLPVDSLPRSRKLRIRAKVRNKKFDGKAYSFSNWCMVHIPVQVARELKLKNNEKVKITVGKILVK